MHCCFIVDSDDVWIHVEGISVSIDEWFSFRKFSVDMDNVEGWFVVFKLWEDVESLEDML